jgi:hypothetical protein
MHDEMKPQMAVPDVDNHEGQMARADLYRAAKNAMKLFEMVQEGSELEGWVQAKITKAADYLDSVYHYMEYQVKFGNGGVAKSVADITGEAEIKSDETVSEEDDEVEMKESYEQKLQALLESAIKKTKSKKDQAVDEAKFAASGVRATDKKKGKVEKTTRKSYFLKFEKEGRTKGVTMVADEGESLSDMKDRAKRENMGWSLASVREKESVEESKHEDAKAAEEEKRKKEEKKKKIAKIVDEGKSEAQKAAQEKFKAMIAKKKGNKKDDKKVDEAKGKKPDFLDVDKDGDKKEPMKKALADKKKNPVQKADETLDMNLIKSAQGAMTKNKKDKESDDNVRKPYGYRGASGSENDDSSDKKSKSKKEAVAESSDLDTILKLAGRRPLVG